MKSRSRLALRVASAMLALAVTAQRAVAQCDSVVSRTALSSFSGSPIRSLRIVTLAMAPMPGPARLIDNLHVRTRESTIRRQLLFAAGDTVDTLRVAESLRRLRRLRYLADAAVEARRCGADRAVDVTVTTRDAWSARAAVTMRSAATSSIALEERNVLGTGRALRAYVRSDGSRIGVGAALKDPWVLGSRVAAEVGTNVYRDGRDVAAGLATREESVFDRWRAEATASHSVREAPSGGDTVRRDAGAILVGRRVHASADQATSLLAGFEVQHTALASASDAPILGPATVRRTFAALDVGALRRTARYDTLTWLLPGRTIVDVPLGLETETVVGGGYELVSHEPALHLDTWIGRMWLPARNALVVADLWSSGYLEEAGWDAATLRGAVSFYHAAPRGVWTARLAGERLYRPDPDLRALASPDPTLAALPARARFAATAWTGSVERALRLRGLTRSWALDGALFTAASWREDPVRPAPDKLYVGVIGAGLRIAPTKLGRGTFRLDLGYAALHSPQVKPRVVAGLSLSPWLEEGRQRDGRRIR